ncbi:cytokine receptor-like [Tachypleus tridentatus]|uniref:cytokine receptor-like n=1 Tax=Tachypleus tridentatus TaxID=6853 RepID=UPI003FD37D66
MKNRFWCSWMCIVPHLCVVLKMVDLATACWGNKAQNLGNLTSDYSIEVGSTVDLNCTLHQHQFVLDHRNLQNETYFVNSTNLEFRFNSTTIPREYVHIVNPLTARLQIPNASIAYSGKYYCNLKLPEKKKDITVCLSIIFVGYKPREVDQENFSCLSKNFENLTCCWVPPYNPVRTTYTLKSDVRIGNYLVGSKSCPNNTGVNDTCCQWRLDTNPPYHKNKKELVFKLTGRNHLGNVTQNIIVDHYKFVIPNKPWGLQATGETQKSIKLNWLNPKDFDIWNFEPGLVYELRYKSRSDDNQKWKNINVGKGRQTYNLTGLIPNTVYELSVRCRSAKAEGEEMWSQPAVIIARTNPDVPYYLPNITKGSFEIKKLSTSRSITLHWKPVPPEHYNGQDFHYVITYKPVYNTMWKREVLEQTVEVTGFRHTFTDMDLNTVYYFKFQSANKEGLSSSMVDITVDKTKNLPITPVEVTAMSYGNGTYQVNWDYPERERSVITRFTIYWCPNLQPHPFLCRLPIKWMTVPANSTYANIQLSDDVNYQFAVSADSIENSSGMKRMLCIVPYEKALDKVQNVYVQKIAQGLQVEWRLACSAQKKVVTQYKVEFCRVKSRLQACVNSQTLTTYNQDATKVNITNLEPFTLYRVTVQVLSKAGISSLSDPKYERTFAGVPSVPQGVKVADVNSSAIRVTWKSPVKPNGIITNYFVHYQHFSQEVAASHTKELYSLVLSKNIESYTNYSIAVQACVDKHCSPASSPVYGMTWIDGEITG